MEDPSYGGPHDVDPTPNVAYAGDTLFAGQASHAGPALPPDATAGERLPWQLREATGQAAVAALRAFLTAQQATRSQTGPPEPPGAAWRRMRAATAGPAWTDPEQVAV